MATRKTPTTTTDQLQTEIEALKESLASLKKEPEYQEIPVIRCTSCWERTGPGTYHPYYNAQGVCSDCQRSNHGPSEDNCMCVRLGWAKGTFVPGIAHAMSRKAGVPIEVLLREDVWSVDQLAELYDSCSEGRWRPRTLKEREQQQQVTEEKTIREKIFSLKSLVNNNRQQINKINDVIAKTEEDIKVHEAKLKAIQDALGWTTEGVN